MTGHVPAATVGISDCALWIAFGWLATTALAVWVGYRRGLLSRQAAEKLNARVEALALADEVIAEIPKQKIMVGLFHKSGNDLKAAVFRLSCQLGPGERKRIQKALDEYQALEIKEDNFTITLSSGREAQLREAHLDKVMQERNAMLESLKRLREVISLVFPPV
jgi:hypothetical protein